MRGVSALVLVIFLSVNCCAERVELEVILPAGTAPTAAHDWMRSLQTANIDRLRLRHDSKIGQPSIESSREAGGEVFQVRAIVIKNRLTVPGAQFSRFEIKQLNDWLADVANHAAGDRDVHAFGMTAEQLLYVHKSLKRPIERSTLGLSMQRFVEAVRFDLDIPLKSPTRLPAEEVLDELSGLTRGTALAAALRPAGLVLVPTRTGTHATDVALEIRRVQDADETWPVGWPTEVRIHKLAPKMLDFLEVEINDTPLAEALTALQGRLEIPFLFDHNGMARHDIDPATSAVSFPLRKTFYKKIVTNLLFQAKLKSELRVDEAGNPLLWIEPIKR